MLGSGKVKAGFNQARGFGFVEPDEGGEDLFLHVRALAPGEQAEDLRDGAMVTYQAERTDRGMRAVDVRVVLSTELERLARAAVRAAEELGAFMRRRGWDV